MDEQNTQMENKETQKPKNKGFKTFLSTLSAAVLGSALTLAVAPQLDLFKEDSVVKANPTEVVSEQSNSDYQVQQVSSSANSIADMVEQASKAIVGVVNYGEQTNPFTGAKNEAKRGTGSGVIYKVTDEEAYIVTNNHVIEGASEVEVSLSNGDVVEAELVGTDPLTDIAVIKIKGKYDISPIPFGDSEKLRAGDQVVAIGNPLGLDLSRTVTKGIVSATGRTVTTSTSSGEWEVEVIQTDAAINPGNSGGALLNMAGELIGINSMKITEDGVEGLGFAIPSNNVVKIMNQLVETGQVERPYLGVGLANLNEIPRFYLKENAKVEEGSIVVNVDENGSAAKAGIRAEDIIVSINGEKIKNSNELRKYLYKEVSIGDKVTIGFYRDGELKKVELTLTSKQQ